MPENETTMTFNPAEVKILESALRALAASESIKLPYEFSAERLHDVRVLRERIATGS